eukprot:COSAG06_NODE_7254_length_2568_cov_2.847712_1_plen_541_part_00
MAAVTATTVASTASRRRMKRMAAALSPAPSMALRYQQQSDGASDGDDDDSSLLLERELEALAAVDAGSGNGSGPASSSRTGAPLFGSVHRQLLLLDGPVRDRVLREWRRRQVRLSAAMYPPEMRHQRAEMPCLWTPEEWARAEAQNRAEPILDATALETQMAAQDGAYARDGYLVLREVMTPEAQAQFVRSMQRCQELNDRLLRCDWASGIDWAGLGWRGATLPRPLSEESIARATGGGQMLNPQQEENGVRLLRQHCVLPEYFPPAHDGFLMRCFFHDDLLNLHRRCLGTEHIYCASGPPAPVCVSVCLCVPVPPGHVLACVAHAQRVRRCGVSDDNAQSNNKSAGYGGGGWHVHGTGTAGSGLFGEVCDNAGVCEDTTEYAAQPCVNIMLVYPMGLSEADGGNINIIRGSHLFRDVSGLRAPPGRAGAEELTAGWLKGRRHPLTGESMRCEKLVLPPGSIVCCNTHAAHGVSPQLRGERLAYSFFFKKRSDRTGMTGAPFALPPCLALDAAEGRLPVSLTEVLRNAFDPRLTGGATMH